MYHAVLGFLCTENTVYLSTQQLKVMLLVCFSLSYNFMKLIIRFGNCCGQVSGPIMGDTNTLNKLTDCEYFST